MEILQITFPELKLGLKSELKEDTTDTGRTIDAKAMGCCSSTTSVKPPASGGGSSLMANWFENCGDN